MEKSQSIFKELSFEELDENVLGGKYTKAQCNMLWLSCLSAQTIGECGGWGQHDTAACELFSNNCY